MFGLRGSCALDRRGGGRRRRGPGFGGGVRRRVGRRRLGVGVRVTVFALRGNAPPVGGGGAPLAALLPHSPRLLPWWPGTSSSSSSSPLIVVLAHAACTLSFADLLPWRGHGTLKLSAQLAVLEGAHLWRHDLYKRRDHPLR